MMGSLFYHYKLIDSLTGELLFDSGLLFESRSRCVEFAEEATVTKRMINKNADLSVDCLYLIENGEGDN